MKGKATVVCAKILLLEVGFPLEISVKQCHLQSFPELIYGLSIPNDVKILYHRMESLMCYSLPRIGIAESTLSKNRLPVNPGKNRTHYISIPLVFQS